MKLLLLSLSFLLFLFFCTRVKGDDVLLRRVRERFLAKQEEAGLLFQDSTSPTETFLTLFFEQRLDHFDPLNLNQTFRQRYFVNNVHHQQGSPIFLYVGGEAELRSTAVTRGFIVDLARRYHGLILALEHRYYGFSHPFKTLTSSHLKFLTSQQALQDLAHFIEHQNSQLNTLNGTQQQWIIVGGSYPGNLAAWFKLKYPHLVVGAWSSSAPVLAKSDYWEYDAVVAQQLGPECADIVRSATRLLEASILRGDRNETDLLKNLFYPQMSRDVPDDIAFLYILADLVAYAVQYDNPGSPHRQRLCAQTASQRKLGAMDALHRFANFTGYMFQYLGTTPREMDMTALLSVEIYSSGDNQRQWLWQCCVEFGYWHTAPSTQSLRSQLINEEWHHRLCQKLFGFPPGFKVPVQNTNTVYGERHIMQSATRILFTHGERDPWKALGVEGWPLRAPALNSLDEEPRALLIPDVGHCADLHGASPKDPQELSLARQMISHEIGRWLTLSEI